MEYTTKHPGQAGWRRLVTLETRSRELSRPSATVIAERRRILEPLFAYMGSHHVIALSVARLAWLRLGAPGEMTKLRLHRIKAGRAILPAGFIDAMCAELGRSVEEVMGAEWLERYAVRDVPTGEQGSEMEMPQAS